MPPPLVEPILLYGFCFIRQQDQRFNQQWACAWLTSWYSDEGYLAAVEDPSKRREIRYGNNIAVLFRVLLHLRQFYGQDGLWSAIGRGFNTSPTIARTTAEILTDARRIQRDKPGREPSEAARAVDEWMEFLDSRRTHPRMLTDPELFKQAEAFFKSQEKKMENAARVPINLHATLQFDAYRPTAADDKAHLSPRLPPTPIKRESPSSNLDKNPLVKPTSKRSASPIPPERSSKTRRSDHPTNGVSTGPDSQQQQYQTRHSKQESSGHLGNAKPVPVKSQPDAHEGRKDASNKAYQTSDKDISVLKARITELESRLAEAKSKQNVITATTPEKLGLDITELKKEMDTATNAIGTMMESMHDIVDSLNSLRDEVAGLTKQQNKLATDHQANGAHALLGAMQTITNSLELLKVEVTQLKMQAAASQQPAPPSSAPRYDPEVKTLLQEQNALIDKLGREMARMQTQTPPTHQRQSPQNIQQAMADAERDLKHHLAVVESLYHQLDSTRGASRMVTERTADFLATLQQSVHSAQIGLRGS
ncbi:hypothetical protein N656DRAFT_711504 [Canariomyces notabilis]|uniref:Uncharacterized protein n=1 Tax=Canariomyces notabilis TaxID=2074819 RepID=A0AAN6TC88_9PEZI|nr:hypothetical protein N656DRAFT_711504 [Canariomyces arenarius]